jgi:hypothetical protein
MGFKVDVNTKDEEILRAAEAYARGSGIGAFKAIVCELLYSQQRIAALEAKVAALENGTPPHLDGIERR